MMSLPKVTPRIALAAGLGWCTLVSAATDPVITSPPAGAVVTPPFTVVVEYGDIAYCDTDGCVDVPAESVELHADPDGDIVSLGDCDTMTECPNGKAIFEVTLEPGEHELRATASDNFFSVAFSEHVKIMVEAAAPTTGEPTSSGGPDTTGPDTTSTSGAPDTTGLDTTSTSGDPDTADSDTTKGADTSSGSKDDGCGCSAANTSGSALAWLTATMLLFRRRR